MWVDYRGPLSTVYNDGEISTCEQVPRVQSIHSPYRFQHSCGQVPPSVVYRYPHSVDAKDGLLWLQATAPGSTILSLFTAVS